MKYQRKTHQLRPFIKQLKISTIVIVVIGFLLVIRQVSEIYQQESVSVSVHKSVNIDTTKKSISYRVVENSIEFNQLTPIQKLLVIKSDFNYDIVFISKMIIIYGLVIFILFRAHSNNVFQKSLSKYFLVLSIFLLCFFLFESYRSIFTSKLIREITDKKYVYSNINNTIFSVDNLLLMGSVWFSIVLFRSEKLQEENDLTV